MADREAYKREYLTIRQKQHESINTFLERFIRVAGIAGNSAGTAAEQAEKFKWALLFNNRRQLVTTRFAIVSDVANAAKTLELERALRISPRAVGRGTEMTTISRIDLVAISQGTQIEVQKGRQV